MAQHKRITRGNTRQELKASMACLIGGVIVSTKTQGGACPSLTLGYRVQCLS